MPNFMEQGVRTASACLFVDAIIGKSVDEAKSMTGDDVIKLLGIPVSASRVTCVTLSLDCFKIAIGDLK
jgi:NifU-like protein involved in Fe-S cluster formation